MKKFLALILAALMCMTLFVACTETADNNGENANPEAEAPSVEADAEVVETADGDLKYVLDKGKLIVGITDFAPMDFQKDGEWVGFDADMAKEFGKYLGVDVEFVEIIWDNKAMELEGKAIDVVWNGMTLTDEVLAAMNCSNPYCNNAQVVIVPKDKNYTDEDYATLTYAVEEGSSGQKAADAEGFAYEAVTDQATALLEVMSNNADAAIIDSLMAGAMVGEGTSYESLTYTIALTEEKYGVGFRKDSNIVEVFNQFLKETYDNGKMMEVAKEYGVDVAIIAQ